MSMRVLGTSMWVLNGLGCVDASFCAQALGFKRFGMSGCEFCAQACRFENQIVVNGV